MLRKDSLRLFDNLPQLTAEDLANIRLSASKNQYRKNDFVFQAGEQKNNIYLLTQGRIKLFRLSSSGREVVQWFCFPDEFFGLSEIQQQGGLNVYAQCCEDSEVLSLSMKQFLRHLDSCPKMALRIIEQLTSRLNVVGDMLLNFTADSAELRLLKLLLRLSLQFGEPLNGGMRLVIKLTHKEISNMVGTCRQTVTTVLGHLRKRNYIDVIGSEIYIPSLERLEQLIDANEVGSDDVEQQGSPNRSGSRLGVQDDGLAAHQVTQTRIRQ